MKSHLRFSIFSLTIGSLGGLGILFTHPAQAQTPLTLDQVFLVAIEHNEKIKIQDKTLEQAQTKYHQALGALYPSLEAYGSYTLQDRPTGSSTVQQFFPRTQPLVRLTAKQPLFRGLREFAALSQAKTNERFELYSLYHAGLLLYLDLASSYFQILFLNKELLLYQTELQLLEQQIQEIKGRVKIGRSRLSEVLNLEASAANLKAQLKLKKSEITIEQELFNFLTGLPTQTQLVDSIKTNLTPANKLETFAQDIEKRPDILVQKEKIDSALAQIKIIRGEHLPEADLTGNYYLKRSGALSNVDWDVQATLTFPIFNGGITKAKVHEAESQLIKEELALTQLRKSAEKEIQSYHTTLFAHYEQYLELQRAHQLSEQNYKEQKKEYRLGLVTNLEVLTSLTGFHKTGRELELAKKNISLNQIKLNGALSKIDAVKNWFESQTSKK